MDFALLLTVHDSTMVKSPTTQSGGSLGTEFLEAHSLEHVQGFLQRFQRMNLIGSFMWLGFSVEEGGKWVKGQGHFHTKPAHKIIAKEKSKDTELVFTPSSNCLLKLWGFSSITSGANRSSCAGRVPGFIAQLIPFFCFLRVASLQWQRLKENGTEG